MLYHSTNTAGMALFMPDELWASPRGTAEHVPPQPHGLKSHGDPDPTSGELKED